MKEFNFDIKKTGIFKVYSLVSFPLFKYAKLLSQVFLYLFVFSLFLVTFSFLGIILTSTAIKISLFILLLLFVSWETYLFSELKIKKYLPSPSLSDAIANPKDYTIAEFLSLNACEIVLGAIGFSKKRKFSEVTSGMLFYASLKNSDCAILMHRLGINVEGLKQDLKNYLEKQRREAKYPAYQQAGNYQFSTSFQKTIYQAAQVAQERGGRIIGEKELLVALAKHDDFFKKVLVDHDLKEKDVQNITLWLDKVEEKIKKSKEFWTKENLARGGSLAKDWAAGFTVTLDRFSIDLTKAASRNIFGEIIGHEKEIDELEIILVKYHQSNALIVGDPGVGKKSIVDALALRCFLQTGLPELHNKRVVQLDMIALATQIQDLEKLETILDQIFEETLDAGNIILVIDQLDRFVEHAASKPGEIDISGILAKYLALPDFHFIGITTFDGLHRKLELNSSFVDYFRKIEVSEVSELDTIRILQNLALQMEQKHQILVSYPAIREIIHLTGRYFPSTPFPKKAIDVLDEAVSYVKSLKDLPGGKYGKIVLPTHIASIISDKTQIPIGKMEFKEKSVLLNLESLIHQRIVGQDEAVNEVSIAMRRARSGLASQKRPMGVFLFLGSTGVGKTEMAKALAQIYFGSVARSGEAGFPNSGEEKMIRIDMSEFQSISDIPRLIGRISPIEEQGLLTTPVRENPFSLVLLDEIEKAHPNILNLFLQVFDEGHITDGQGRKVIFTNTIIICTSNAGANMIFHATKEGQEIDKDNILDALFEKGIFKPEFVNRFDATIFFNPLTKENLLEIAQLSLEGLAKNLKEKEIDFIITLPLKEKIVELSYKPEFGARQMRRIIQDNIENVIAQALLSDTIVKGDTIEINPENFNIIKIHSSN